MKFNKNMGGVDRAVRIGIALGLLVLILLGIIQGWWAILAGVVIVLFLATSTVGVCPAYMPFKFSTQRKHAAELKDPAMSEMVSDEEVDDVTEDSEVGE